MKDEEINVINIQIIALLVSIITAFISLILTINQKLDLQDKNTILDNDDSYTLTLFNRILILILSFVFLYVNYKLYEISKDEGEDLKSYILQIIASVITIIPSLIALYVVFLSNGENVSDVENPII